MKPTSCLFDRLFSAGAGAALFTIGVLVALFSIVTLPFIGLIVAAPALASAVYLIVAARRAECPIQGSD